MTAGAVAAVLMAISGIALLVSSIAAIVAGWNVAFGVFGLVIFVVVGGVVVDELRKDWEGYR